MPLRRTPWHDKQLSDYERGLIIGLQLKDADWSKRRISQHIGRIYMIVTRCWQQLSSDGTVNRRRSALDTPEPQISERNEKTGEESGAKWQSGEQPHLHYSIPNIYLKPFDT